MANYSELLSRIAAAIYTNTTQDIDAVDLRGVLNDMVNTMGAGYTFQGLATTNGTPGTPDQKVFFVTATAGTYTNYGALVVATGELAFLCYDGAWEKKAVSVLTPATVVDNLTTNDATKVLSAKQGKVLKDAADALADDVTELGQEINGIDISETSNPGISSSYWRNNSGVIGNAPSGMGIHRVGYIVVKEGRDIRIETTLGDAGVEAGFFCNSLGQIVQTITKTGASVVFSGTVPSGATRLYINYLSTYTVYNKGIYQRIETLESKTGVLEEDMSEVTDNTIVLQGQMNNIQNDAYGVFDLTYFVEFEEGTSFWNGTVGSEISYSSAALLKRSVGFLNVTPGKQFYIKNGGGEGLSDNADYIITDSNNIILVKETGGKVNYTLVTIPENGTRIYFNVNKDHVSDFSFKSEGEFKNVQQQVFDLLDRQAEYEKSEITAITLSKSLFQRGLVNGDTGAVVASTTTICLIETMPVIGSSVLTYSLNDGYKLGFAFYDVENTIIEKQEWYTTSGFRVVPLNARSMRIEITKSPDTMVIDDFDNTGLSIICDKSIVPDKAASNIELKERFIALKPFIDVEDLSNSPLYSGLSKWEDDGQGYIQQAESPGLYRFEPIIVPADNLVFLHFLERVAVNYTTCFFTDNNDKILGTLNESDKVVEPPIGTTKMYVNTGGLSYTFVHIFVASGKLIDNQDTNSADYISIYAPSPQLPANNTDDSDFNCETVTSQDFHTAFENLISDIPEYFRYQLGLPKTGNVFEKVGTDASGQLSIKSYVFCRRNRYAWKKADRLYAYANGNTVVYIDSCSPFVGSAVYSDADRTSLGTTISSYDGITVSFTDSNGDTYTRDAINDVSADVVYTNQLMLEEGSANMEVFSKTDASLGTGTGIDATHLSYSSKTYDRCESLDYHTEHKGTIVLWANEHGPQSDPCEPSVILYRMAKDITDGCRNNPFLQYLWKYFKIVFIPAANPYGIDHKTRGNYTGININRNYNTPGWYTIADSDKGNYPGDQPETQYIMNTVKFFDASIAIDIHCLGYVGAYPYPSREYYPAGRTHFEGVIPDGADGIYNSRAKETMGGLSCSYTSYGNGDYETGSQGADWLNYENIHGGLIEMTSGDGASSYNGKQHTARILFVDYTLLLNTLRVWLSGFDQSTNLSKIGIW